MGCPVVSIIGRPNVGKSSLLNKILGQRKAIVDDMPGVTRDRLYVNASWLDRSFTMIDTGGIFFDKKYTQKDNYFQKEIDLQVMIAIEESDLILFMVNVEEGITTYDQYIATELAKQNKPVLLVVNKVENQKRQLEATAFYELGFDKLMNVSALHGNGVGDLLDEIIALIPMQDDEKIDDKSIPVAIVGKPNVGKSSLFNLLIGSNRSIVSDIAGTTRDIVDQEIVKDDQSFVFVDTAGIRRKSKVIHGVENYSVLRAVKAVSEADVVLLVLNVAEPLSDQDKKIAGIIEEQGKSCLIVANKWDLIEKDNNTFYAFEEMIRKNFYFIKNVPILFVSALSGQRVNNIFENIVNVYHEFHKRLNTSDLNNVVLKAVSEKIPPSYKGKRLKILYVTQPKTSPPIFLFFVNDKKLVHFSYRRYLENKIRESFGFAGVVLRISFRSRKK
jgi:GTPase